jgi:hypothetical protein
MKIKSKFHRKPLAVLTGLIISQQAFAEATIQRDENLFLNIGIASRVSFSSVSDAAPNGSSRSKDFEVEEARLYTNGKLHKNVTYEFNFARNTADDKIELLDGHLGLEVNNYVNIWAGRFLPAASRASASAPMYSTTFDFPIAEQGSYEFAGRDNGAVSPPPMAGKAGLIRPITCLMRRVCNITSGIRKQAFTTWPATTVKNPFFR